MSSIRKGIDISKHNGNINFAKVKAAGIDFVIIRAGYGKSVSQKDPMFETYYKEAKNAGLDVGAYWFSYSLSPDISKIEAECCVECIKGKKFEYPIYLDLETDERSKYYPFDTGRQNCSKMVDTFCQHLETAGYFAGLYISRSPLQTHITDRIARRYALWIAEYNTKCNYTGSYGMWQHTPSGRVDGINGNVDLDVCYVGYPNTIKKAKLNGYKDKKYRIEVGDFDEVRALEEFEKLKMKYPNAIMKEVL